jgi:uncharacterized protein (UPF0335 family)
MPDIQWQTVAQEKRTAAAWQHLDKSSSPEDRKVRLHILAFPNMLERLAGMYNDGLLDDAILKVYVESEANGFLSQAASWLTEMRKQNKDYLTDIDTMVKKLAEKPRTDAQ